MGLKVTFSRDASRNGIAWATALFLLAALAAPTTVRAQDIEAEAWPEFDIWINLDEAGKNRIYILSSFANVAKYQYQETALGASWDRRFHKRWSWRVGIRYIWKEVDPPDKNETRAVFDLKWYQPLPGGFMLTDRNRLDLRRFDGDSDTSYRYRNRVQVEKTFTALSRPLTGFLSYEFYYDSRYDEWGQRQRVIAGASLSLTDWLSVDVFPAYHYETKPKSEDAVALGVAFGIYFK